MSDEEDLSAKLEGLLSEVTKVMESRKERIEELRAEIDQIEKENEDRINEMEQELFQKSEKLKSLNKKEHRLKPKEFGSGLTAIHP